jgi:RNA polymerase sigma-70 factor (ECF subfamily)
MTQQDVDFELVKRVQRGEKSAFNLLVIKYQYRVIKLVGRYVHDQGDVLDVTQEAFIKAYRALGRFRGDSAFYTWLYRIAINTAKNYVVAKDRRPPDTDVDVADAELFETRGSLRDLDSPEHEVLSAEIERTVFSAIDKLPKDLRVAITLRELEGLSYEEIAQVMGCPVGTVRSRIFRAREIVDKALAPLLKE